MTTTFFTGVCFAPSSEGGFSTDVAVVGGVIGSSREAAVGAAVSDAMTASRCEPPRVGPEASPWGPEE